MSRQAATLAITTCVIAICVAGCGAHVKRVVVSTGAPSSAVGVHLAPIKACLSSHGYAVEPETPQDVRTAPRRFQFVAVWNVVNPSRVSLAIAISKSTSGAARGAAWTRAENAKIDKGAVKAPVARIGRVDVLWTSQPGAVNRTAVYGCVRPHA